MADPELAYPGDPFGLGVRSTMQSSSVYLTDDDTQLRIVSCNAAAGVGVGFQGLRIDEKGVPQSIIETHTPATNRTVTVQNYKIGKGTLLRLTAFVSAGTPLYGQTYVMAQLVRGVSGPVQVLATLIGGYITANQALGFPGSPVRSSIEGGGYVRGITGSTPGAGQDFNEGVPFNARWQLLALQLGFRASGAVATRVPVLKVNTQGVPASQAFTPSNIHAGDLRRFLYGPNFPLQGPIQLSTSEFLSQQPFTEGLVMLSGDAFFAITDQIQAGDQWAAPNYYVREWLEF